MNSNSQEKMDKVILGEGSLQELTPFFEGQEDLLKFYATRMSELFPSDRDLRLCEACSRNPAELKTEFVWRGAYHTNKTSVVNAIGIIVVALTSHLFRFLIPAKEIGFVTTHCFCKNCFSQTQRCRLKAKFIRLLCLTLIVVAALIFASVIVFGLLFIIPNLATDDLLIAVAGIICAVACLMTGFFGIDRAARWCIPKPIRFISKAPFELIGVRQIQSVLRPLDADRHVGFAG